MRLAAHTTVKDNNRLLIQTTKFWVICYTAIDSCTLRVVDRSRQRNSMCEGQNPVPSDCL